MEKILIIGGAGFIGSILAKQLAALNYKITLFDSLDPEIHPGGKPPAYLTNKMQFIKGDVCDYNHLHRVIKDKSTVIYLAAHGNRYKDTGFRQMIHKNSAGIANLLDILAHSEHCCTQFVLGSSILCDSKIDYTIPEQHSPDEYISYYAQHNIFYLTQKIKETLTLDFAQAFKFPVLILRYGSVFGPHQSLAHNAQGIFSCFLINDQPPLIYHNDNAKRDFMYIDDAITQTIDAIRSHTTGCNITPILGGNCFSMKTLAYKLAKLLNKDIEPYVTEKRRPHDASRIEWNLIYKEYGVIKKRASSIDKYLRKFTKWILSEEAQSHYNHAIKLLKKRTIL